MVYPKLASYIKSQLAKGISTEKIKQNLLRKGWSKKDINQALKFSLNKKGFDKELKKPQRRWFILGGISIILIIAILILFFSIKNERASNPSELGESNLPSQIASSSIIDCEEDMGCFISASENCELSKVTFASTLDLLGMMMTSTIFYEIKEKEGEKCVLYLRAEKYEMSFSEEAVQQMLGAGVTQEEIQQQVEETNKEYLDPFEGKEGLCTFNPAEDLTELLIKFKSGTSSSHCSLTEGCTTDWDVAECGGEMFETENVSLDV